MRSHLIDEKDPIIGHIAASAIPFGRMLRILYALFALRITDEDKLSWLREILKKCIEANERGNELVHSHWQPDKERGALRFKIRLSLRTLTSRRWSPFLEISSSCEHDGTEFGGQNDEDGRYAPPQGLGSHSEFGS